MIHIKSTLQDILDKKAPNLVFAYLFGSQTSEDSPYPPGDIDLAVFFRDRKAEHLLDAKVNLYSILSRTLKTNDIDILVLNTARNLILLDEIIRYGIRLIDREPDLREEFEQKILHQALDFKSQRLSLIGF